MAIVNTEDVTCPVCGEETASNDLNTVTSEKDFACGNCGFSYVSELVERNGKQFWREIQTMPMTGDGKVRRPQSTLVGEPAS